jgi:alkylation response protein AidB-like acyl-CoA dehydrogenase
LKFIMLLDLTPDQDFLRQTTAKFLSNEAPVAEVRRLREDPGGFDRKYWQRGADLGWTSLLVSEEKGGGSVSGRGLVDLTLIAHEFGRHAAPGPLIPGNVVASALSSAAGTHDEVLAGLMSGTAVAAWCWEEPVGAGQFGDVNLEARVDGQEIVLNGVKRPVEAAAQADYLLVTGRTNDGLTQVLLPASTAGVSIRPMRTVDLTRRCAVVGFDQVRVPLDSVVGEAGESANQVEQQLSQALVISNAESVGTMEKAFDITVEWAFDRYTFGRPLASYQELKHRFADMKSWLEASHAVADAAAAAVDSQSPEARELVSVAKAFIGQYGGELLHDCVQMHGGIGVTFDHDLHLFLRRGTINRGLLGTPADHRQRVARMALAQEAS